MLNLARAVQGVGGAIMFATSLALIAAAFTGQGPRHRLRHLRRRRSAAPWPSARSIGGAITSGIGWRWIFFVNVPIGAIAVFITFAKVAKSTDLRQRRIDWVGLHHVLGSLFALVFALVRGNDLGWGSATIVGLLVASAVLMVAFFVNERYTEDPMLDLGPVQDPGVRRPLGRRLHAGGLDLRHVLVPDAVHPGQPGLRPAGRRASASCPMTLLVFVVSFFAGRLTVRVHSRLLLGVGMLLIAGGLLLDGDDPPELDLDRPVARASSCPASASASSTRSWPPAPSRSCSHSAAAWPRGPTTRSARSASPRASPSSVRCSRARS